MKAYSTDLRERVILAANQGMPQTEIAKVFAISLSTIKRYIQHPDALLWPEGPFSLLPCYICTRSASQAGSPAILATNGEAEDESANPSGHMC